MGDSANSDLHLGTGEGSVRSLFGVVLVLGSVVASARADVMIQPVDVLTNMDSEVGFSVTNIISGTDLTPAQHQRCHRFRERQRDLLWPRLANVSCEHDQHAKRIGTGDPVAERST